MSDLPIEFSGTLGSLAKALAAAQGEIANAKKDATNPHFKNSYASLASIRDAITPALSRHGLAVSQLTEPHGPEGVCVVTMLMHESGEWIRSRLFVPVSKKDAQGFGSALSYARRYALAAIANVATDDDDDAETAVKPSNAKAAEQKSPPAKSDVDVDALVKGLENAADAEQLSIAVIAVSRVKDKLTKADSERLRSAHDTTMRAIESKQAS